MKVTVYGSGYVGLVTAACLAKTGNHVVCMDINNNKIEQLKNDHIPIYEPGLESIVKNSQQSKQLIFTTNNEMAVQHGHVQFIAVGTPPLENGAADLQYVKNVAKTIGEKINHNAIIINKSTVPIGTADKVRELINEQLAKRNLAIEFDVVSNPEFLKEGSAVNDFMKPDRIIIGTNNAKSMAILKTLFAPFNRSHEKIITMSTRSAELTKYAANAMLATKISFINEIANIAEKVGADIEQVRNGIGSDPRIGYSFIYPGIGYGGSCFPKDVKALNYTAEKHGYDSSILKAVDTVNNNQKRVLFNKIFKHFNGELAEKTIALWGLAFKPETNDMREAPSCVLMEELWQHGAHVNAFDPQANKTAKLLYPNNNQLTLCNGSMETLNNADALAIATEWKGFWSPNFNEIKNKLKNALIFDGRNIYDPDQLEKLGFTYYAIGRGKRCT